MNNDQNNIKKNRWRHIDESIYYYNKNNEHHFNLPQNLARDISSVVSPEGYRIIFFCVVKLLLICPPCF